ncbi:hypothetical protein HYC85_009791 [Camellia sinensis]|uniref:Uncharacterized protein n=1 Tax=Camellia sinensis TaxID=4442 RepID=A0A7J7HHE3_CAMSI|nr:hypothetical protein HYC85_009791 [Camellia sinensis]
MLGTTVIIPSSIVPQMGGGYSTGTFKAASRYGSATPPPPSVLSRGAGWLDLIMFCNVFSENVVPQYFNEYMVTSGRGPVHSSSAWLNKTMQVVFTSPATVAAIIAVFLDRTVARKHSSTRTDSGSHWWEKFSAGIVALPMTNQGFFH